MQAEREKDDGEGNLVAPLRRERLAVEACESSGVLTRRSSCFVVIGHDFAIAVEVQERHRAGRRVLAQVNASPRHFDEVVDHCRPRKRVVGPWVEEPLIELVGIEEVH